MHCTNTGASVALSGTFSLARNTTRFDQPGPSQIQNAVEPIHAEMHGRALILLPLRIAQRLVQKMGPRQLQRIVLGVI